MSAGIADLPTISVVSSSAGMMSLRTEWTALFANCPSAPPPLRWNWVNEWWNRYGPIYGNHGSGLRILTARRDSRLVGILPLYEGVKHIGSFKVCCLSSISSGADEFEETNPGGLQMLFAPGEEEPCAEAIADAVFRSEGLHWTQVLLPAMSVASQLAQQLMHHAAGWAEHARVIGPRPSFVINLDGGFENYLQRLGRRVRENSRRLLRKAKAAGMEFQVARTVAEADCFLDQLIELHRRRWRSKGKPGSFAPRHEGFHRAVARAGVPTGDVILARLSLNGTPLAVTYGHRVGTQYHSYQKGVDTETQTSVRSPGTAAHLLLFEYLAGNGVTRVDLQEHGNTFKQDYHTDVHELIDLRISRPSVQGCTYAMAKFCRRAFRKVARSFSGGERPLPAAIQPRH